MISRNTENGKPRRRVGLILYEATIHCEPRKLTVWQIGYVCMQNDIRFFPRVIAFVVEDLH